MGHTGPPIVVIGCSWGGLGALSAVLEGLPDDLDTTVIVVQHRLHKPSELAQLLAAHTGWPVCEAEDKEPLSTRKVYLAPPGYHLLVDDDRFALSTEGPVQYSRPSIDVLFEAVAEAYGPRVIGVVLTGANDDGAAGLQAIVRNGGIAIVQDPATAERSEMPQAALATGVEASVVPLADLGGALSGAVRARASQDSDAT
ncbi:MAG TPA: chemotaxis protein CheB [Acidimicrobiales bacterium]|nr:chemotaxis protein CheB [Acidimicrobiales bacterium]